MFNTNMNLIKFKSNKKWKKIEKYLREMEIESLFISYQSPIVRLFDRCDALWLQ